MSKAWAGGSTRRWRGVRAHVLDRDAHTCRLHQPGTWRTRDGKTRRCLRVADTAHHIHGKNRCAGCRADDPDHLIASCTPCNLKIGDPGRHRTLQQRTRGRTQW